MRSAGSCPHITNNQAHPIGTNVPAPTSMRLTDAVGWHPDPDRGGEYLRVAINLVVACRIVADSPSNPHDAYFRQVMSRPADAAGEFQAVLPKGIATRLDWDTLTLQPCSFVSQQLRSRYSDLLSRTRLDDW
ncbi:Rpn family recombination-promoting nuclease/putative transposase [Nocardia sp. NPDC088792]|uniref:Rpn family recombination-promoting nuclease/putative transposase n=1 Tax=Nocardia sp. NPDC088792 TaxID=3364332 RepID=UPI00380A8AD8